MNELLTFILLTTGPTYTKDIKPMFENHCATCHNTNWPDKNWLDYNTTKLNKDKIMRRVVVIKDMPLNNLTHMTDAERDIIKQWIDEGCNK